MRGGATASGAAAGVGWNRPGREDLATDAACALPHAPGNAFIRLRPALFQWRKRGRERRYSDGSDVPNGERVGAEIRQLGNMHRRTGARPDRMPRCISRNIMQRRRGAEAQRRRGAEAQFYTEIKAESQAQNTPVSTIVPDHRPAQGRHASGISGPGHRCGSRRRSASRPLHALTLRWPCGRAADMTAAALDVACRQPGPARLHQHPVPGGGPTGILQRHAGRHAALPFSRRHECSALTSGTRRPPVTFQPASSMLSRTCSPGRGGFGTGPRRSPATSLMVIAPLAVSDGRSCPRPRRH